MIIENSTRTKLLTVSIATLLIGMTFFTFFFSTENECVPIGSEFQVNTETISNQVLPSLAMNSSGSFVITWQSFNQDGDGYGIYAQRYDRNGNPIGGEFQVNSNITNNQEGASIAMDSMGNFIIVWSSNQQDGSGNGIFAKRYDSNGNELSPPPSALKGGELGNEFRVNTNTTNHQMYQSVAMDSTGNFVVAWQSFGQDGSDFGIFAQRYNDTGTPQGAEFQVNVYTMSGQTLPSVAMDSTGNFVIAWQSFGQDIDAEGVFAMRFDSSGNGLAPPGGANKGWGLGNEFQVSIFEVLIQDQPSVAMDSTGNFVIAYQYYGIYAQRYDFNGNLIGSDFQVNTNPTSSPYGPSTAMNSLSNFVIVWESNGLDGSGNGVYAQKYDDNGDPIEGEFKVNTNTTNNQDKPCIAMNSSADFVIAWQSDGQDGDGFGIFSQRYTFPIQLEINDVQLVNITDTSASISWNTNLPANSTVDYGFTTSYGTTIEDNDNVTLHSINLPNLEPGRLYHFKVASYNDSANYNVSLGFTFTTKFPIDLKPGWNMISVPLNQTELNLGKVLENISGDYDGVYWYDVNDPMDFWKLNHTGKPPLMNDLNDINRGMGIWIHITNPSGTTLYVNGTAPEIGYINQNTLRGGWNFVGYPSLIERAPNIAGLPSGVDVVQWYNASSAQWESWDPGTYYDPDTLTKMKPGQGFWIHYNGSTDIWSLEYVN